MSRSSIGGKHEGIRRVLATGPYRNFVYYSEHPILSPTQAWEGALQEDCKIVTVGDTRYMFYACGVSEEGVSSPFGTLAMNVGLRTQAITDPPQTWTPHASNPIVPHGASGWSYPFITAPVVIPMQDGSYRMYAHGYGGIGGVWADRAGVLFCTAENFPVGPWTDYPGNPILDVGSPGSWDSDLIRPEVIIPPWVPAESYRSVSSDGLWHMVYGAYDGTHFRGGHAISVDGLAWTKDALNPVWTPSNTGAWDGVGIHPVGQPFLINGLHHILYQGLDSTGLWRIGVAGTLDFQTFVPSPLNPILMPVRICFDPKSATVGERERGRRACGATA